MLFLWYPKCTTCQKAKAFLDERDVSYEARDIKLENPTAEELRGWWEKSGMPLKTDGRMRTLPSPLNFFSTSATASAIS